MDSTSGGKDGWAGQSREREDKMQTTRMSREIRSYLQRKNQKKKNNDNSGEENCGEQGKPGRPEIGKRLKACTAKGAS